MRPSSPRSSRISSTTARYSVSSSRIRSSVAIAVAPLLDLDEEPPRRVGLGRAGDSAVQPLERDRGRRRRAAGRGRSRARPCRRRRTRPRAWGRAARAPRRRRRPSASRSCSGRRRCRRAGRARACSRRGSRSSCQSCQSRSWYKNIATCVWCVRILTNPNRTFTKPSQLSAPMGHEPSAIPTRLPRIAGWAGSALRGRSPARSEGASRRPRALSALAAEAAERGVRDSAGEHVRADSRVARAVGHHGGDEQAASPHDEPRVVACRVDPAGLVHDDDARALADEAPELLAVAPVCEHVEEVARLGRADPRAGRQRPEPAASEPDRAKELREVERRRRLPDSPRRLRRRRRAGRRARRCALAGRSSDVPRM